MKSDQNKMEQDFLEFLNDLRGSKIYEVRLDTPMGEDYVNMIKIPEHKILSLIKTYFPEEMI